MHLLKNMRLLTRLNGTLFFDITTVYVLLLFMCPCMPGWFNLIPYYEEIHFDSSQ